ncbi:GNAT family N-acetyltransferase [Streptomyces lunaelactis]|uniref:GNAT family N-acetyltransferase n=1 Tax=Streptomyces lunaelactis TaxID=1535768 RepID=A0A2R4T9L2_9ACTN|nr:GNAT family N-acetyltransferase [Streptomyces lunaelactis]AVZ75812.1 GNAT family N-acetyltransferase [Streptomyces lunaelactis]NUK84695.1 GNAT family N-acetyltransferase [Streptomyces lunaelactis]
MTTAQAVTLRTVSQLAPVRDDLIAVYSDVRAELLHLPNYAVAAFAERLDRHGSDHGWAAVLAYADNGEPVGYAYSNVVHSENRWWKRIAPAPAAQYTEQPTVALKELGVCVPWRKTGTSVRLHEALLAHHVAEPYVSLMVNPAAGEGKVQRLYESWGYRSIGTSQPTPDSPVLTAMVRRLPPGE